MTNLVSKRSELIKYNTANASDTFAWLIEERGLSLSMLDAESNLSQVEEVIENFEEYLDVLYEQGDKQNYILNNWNHNIPETPNRQFDYELNERNRLRQVYANVNSFVNALKEKASGYSDILKSEGSIPDEEENKFDLSKAIPTHWTGAKAYWNRVLEYIDTHELSREQLVRLNKKVEMAKRKRSISSLQYRLIAYHCARELNWTGAMRRLEKYGSKCRTSAFEYVQPEPKEEKLDAMDHLVDDVQVSDGVMYCQMSFSVEDSIDRMREAREYADLNGMSTEDAWYELNTQSE